MDSGKPPDKITDTQTPEKMSTQLSKEEFLKYVEIDLWNRFSERLWKVVGVVLTVSALLGIFGVPYYIKTEVTDRLTEQKTQFNDRMSDVIEYSKLLSLLRGRYAGERSRFDSDVLQLVNALDERNKGKQKNKEEEDDEDVFAPSNELRSLIARSDFAEVLSSPIARRGLEVPNDLKGRNVVPKTYITVVGSGFTLATGGKEPHPIKNGTYDGEIEDLKFRVVVLEALRAATDKLQQDMISLEIDSTTPRRRVTVEGLMDGDFHKNFLQQMALIANAFLDDTERGKFAQCQKLYTLGHGGLYDAGAQPAKAVAVP